MGKLKHEIAFDVRKESNSTLQGINISHPKALLSRWVFLFPRWDMLVLRRVRLARTCLKHGSPVLLRAHIGRHFSVSFAY